MQEIRNFIGIVYMMSVYKLPATRMYWNNTTRIERIATVMTCNRWEAIKNHLHFNNNDTIPPDNIDKLFKIRPLLSSLLTKFQSTPIDEHLSLDEQIVPFKGKSSLKQYNPKKPKKWGYKIFVSVTTRALYIISRYMMVLFWPCREIKISVLVEI